MQIAAKRPIHEFALVKRARILATALYELKADKTAYF
jgi:hypothetical protein